MQMVKLFITGRMKALSAPSMILVNLPCLQDDIGTGRYGNKIKSSLLACLST